LKKDLIPAALGWTVFVNFEGTILEQPVIAWLVERIDERVMRTPISPRAEAEPQTISPLGEPIAFRAPDGTLMPDIGRTVTDPNLLKDLIEVIHVDEDKKAIREFILLVTGDLFQKK
jgi:hypothetical protein